MHNASDNADIAVIDALSSGVEDIVKEAIQWPSKTEIWERVP